jgi:hypothetical protein
VAPQRGPCLRQGSQRRSQLTLDDLGVQRRRGATIAELAERCTASTARRSWHSCVSEPVEPRRSASSNGTSGTVVQVKSDRLSCEFGGRCELRAKARTV